MKRNHTTPKGYRHLKGKDIIARTDLVTFPKNKVQFNGGLFNGSGWVNGTAVGVQVKEFKELCFYREKI